MANRRAPRPFWIARGDPSGTDAAPCRMASMSRVGRPSENRRKSVEEAVESEAPSSRGVAAPGGWAAR